MPTRQHLFVSVCLCPSRSTWIVAVFYWGRHTVNVGMCEKSVAPHPHQGHAATDVHSLLQLITIVNRWLCVCVCGCMCVNVSKRQRPTTCPDIYNHWCVFAQVQMCVWERLHVPTAHINVLASGSGSSWKQLLFWRRSESRHFAFTTWFIWVQVCVCVCVCVWTAKLQHIYMHSFQGVFVHGCVCLCVNKCGYLSAMANTKL